MKSSKNYVPNFISFLLVIFVSLQANIAKANTLGDLILHASEQHTNKQVSDKTLHSKKVIMIVSSYGEQQGQVKPGYEFDEFAKAYNVFKMNGIEVDVASPKGGKVEADKFDAQKPYNMPNADHLRQKSLGII